MTIISGHMTMKHGRRQEIIALAQAGGLPEEGRERTLIDFGRAADFDVPDVLALALEQSPWIFQCGPAKEAELHVSRRGVDVGYGRVLAHPAPGASVYDPLIAGG